MEEEDFFFRLVSTGSAIYTSLFFGGVWVFRGFKSW